MFPRCVVVMAMLAPLAAGGVAQGRTDDLTLGIAAAPFSDAAAPDAGDRWLWRAVDVGAQLVMLGADWSSIAPVQRPPAFDADDADDAAYRFASLDAQLRALAAQDRRIGLTVSRAPAWATAPGAPSDASAGAWRPSAAEYGRFARALARRYDGTFPDPLRPGRVLPAVEAFQAWAEPNLAMNLAPQWTGRGAGLRPDAPAHYRRLLNAFYAGVRAVSRRALVVTAGTAPFGDARAGGARTPPARFWREVLCLRGRALRPASCPDPARFDVLAHHPYSVGGPRRQALNEDDVSVPDLGKLTRPLRRAERTGRALPRKRHRLWVTEFSWDTRPPDPHGVPAERHARWMAEAFELFWRQGVDTVAWFMLRDELGAPFETTYQSGLYTHDGAAKPAARSFRFPFTARRHGARVTVWARAPQDGVLRVQRRVGDSWRTIASSRERAGTARTYSVRAPRGARIRGAAGGQTSISWPT